MRFGYGRSENVSYKYPKFEIKSFALRISYLITKFLFKGF